MRNLTLPYAATILLLTALVLLALRVGQIYGLGNGI